MAPATTKDIHIGREQLYVFLSGKDGHGGLEAQFGDNGVVTLHVMHRGEGSAKTITIQVTMERRVGFQEEKLVKVIEEFDGEEINGWISSLMKGNNIPLFFLPPNRFHLFHFKIDDIPPGV